MQVLTQKRVKTQKLHCMVVKHGWLLSGANKPSESHLEICRYSPIVGDARLLALDRKELMMDNINLQIYIKRLKK